MVKGQAEHGQLLDVYGRHAFYSAGYSLLLAPFFVLFGSSIAVGPGVNMLLTAITTWLYRLALALSDDRGAGLLGVAAPAVGLAGIWNAAMPAKENLSTPLFLRIALCAIRIARDEDRPSRRWWRACPGARRGSRGLGAAALRRRGGGSRPAVAPAAPLRLRAAERRLLRRRCRAGARALAPCDQPDGRPPGAHHQRRLQPLSRQQSGRDRPLPQHR